MTGGDASIEFCQDYSIVVGKSARKSPQVNIRKGQHVQRCERQPIGLVGTFASLDPHWAPIGIRRLATAADQLRGSRCCRLCLCRQAERDAVVAAPLVLRQLVGHSRARTGQIARVILIFVRVVGDLLPAARHRMIRAPVTNWNPKRTQQHSHPLSPPNGTRKSFTQLVDYIRIPAKSPHFDPQWEAARPHRARHPPRGSVGEEAAGARSRRSRSCACPVARRLLYFDVPGTGDRTVLLVRPSRQAAGDEPDGATVTARGIRCSRTASSTAGAARTTAYAVFAALAAIGALQAQGVAHSRCAGMIETCEESGS